MSACAKFQFVVGGAVWCWVGSKFQVSTVSNLNLSCIELELGLGFDNCFRGILVDISKVIQGFF